MPSFFKVIYSVIITTSSIVISSSTTKETCLQIQPQVWFEVTFLTLRVSFACNWFGLALIQILNAWTWLYFLFPFAYGICHESRISEQNRIYHWRDLWICEWKFLLTNFAVNSTNGVIPVCICINTTWLTNCKFGDFLGLLLLSTLFFWLGFWNHLDVHKNWMAWFGAVGIWMSMTFIWICTISL